MLIKHTVIAMKELQSDARFLKKPGNIEQKFEQLVIWVRKHNSVIILKPQVR